MIGSGQPAQSWLPSSGENQLSSEDVHVWCVAVEPLIGRVHQLIKLLSQAERQRASAFVHRVDRERFVVAHGALRKLAGCYLGVAPEAVQFSETAYEKPCLEGALAESGLQFNLSHSQGYVLIAFARQRQVGVDLEWVRPLPDLEQIAIRTFSPAEGAAWMDLPSAERLAGFYRCWTRKEAFIKALGSGLSYPLKRFSVSLSSEAANCLLQVDEPPAEALRWVVLGLETVAGYAAALAVEGNDWRPVFWQYRFAE